MVPTPSSRCAVGRHVPQIAFKLTADELELAVEKAENLWAEALAAREKAEKLSGDAEEAANESAATAEAASETIDGAEKFKLSMIGDAQKASSMALDAGSLLAEAVEASEEAERLEGLAEAALASVEAAMQELEDEE